jgi:hypothetical protein
MRKHSLGGLLKLLFAHVCDSNILYPGGFGGLTDPFVAKTGSGCFAFRLRVLIPHQRRLCHAPIWYWSQILFLARPRCELETGYFFYGRFLGDIQTVKWWAMSWTIGEEDMVGHEWALMRLRLRSMFNVRRGC